MNLIKRNFILRCTTVASRAHSDRGTKNEKSPVDGQFKVISNVTLRKVTSIHLDSLHIRLLNVSIHMFYVKY